jgi:gas vesicle protein
MLGYRFKLESVLARNCTRGSGMVFDILSFVAGVVAGAVAGGLAGVLHGLESTADLQERVRALTRDVQNTRAQVTSDAPEVVDRAVKLKMDELQKDLDEIHEQIRRMYKGTR